MGRKDYGFIPFLFFCRILSLTLVILHILRFFFFTRNTQFDVCIVMAYKITSLLEIDQVIKEYQIIIYNKKIINIIR